MLHLLSACWFHNVADESNLHNESCTMCKLYNRMYALHCCISISKQGKQQWTKHTAVESSGAQCDGAGGILAALEKLGFYSPEIQDLAEVPISIFSPYMLSFPFRC